MSNTEIQTSNINIFYLILFSGLAGIVLFAVTRNLILLGAIVLLPFIFVTLIQMVKHPIVLFYLIFIFNYFLLGIARYTDISGVSFFMDILMATLLVLVLIHSSLFNTIDWKPAINLLTIGSFIWMIYCILEVINPSSYFSAWILSRGLIINGFLISLLVSLLCTQYKTIRILFFLLSVFTLMAILKAIIQKYVGFDIYETKWLNEGSGKTHLLMSGTRYFSFFTDAGNFGSNMGCAGTIFAIATIYTRNRMLKMYYGFIAIASIYAMFLSGTRGAMIVPLGGLALYAFVSKNIKALIAGSITLFVIYVFFAFTYIGQGNPMIRRMRTAFNPTEDGSFNVRRDNQKQLAAYLKNKPFGEGLGLSGVENQKTSMRFTTSIPHDSFYVKLWVETGIVGFMLHMGILITVMIRCSWILMFKIKDPELKGRLTGLLCGIFGMFLSAYGNAFWGQYPTNIIVYTGLSLILKGEYFDKERTKQLQPSIQTNNDIK